MSFLTTIIGDVRAAGRFVVKQSKNLAAKTVEVSSAAYGKLGSWIGRGYGKVSEKLQKTGYLTRLLCGLVVYLTFFFLWQMLAYDYSHTLFVIVNMVLITAMAGLISLVVFDVKRQLAEKDQKMSEEQALRKKKEREISQLKTELHEFKIQQRNKLTFGKNTQSLIDAFKKNKEQRRQEEPAGQYILRSLVDNYEICCGLVYMKAAGQAAEAVEGAEAEAGGEATEREVAYELAGEFALLDDPLYKTITAEDGIAGQSIKTGKVMLVQNVPENYMNISSGLGATGKLNLYVLPIKRNGEVEAIAEVASFGKLAIADIWTDIEEMVL